VLKNFLKETIVLWIAVAMVFSSVVVTANKVNNKDEIKTSYYEKTDEGSLSTL